MKVPKKGLPPPSAPLKGGRPKGLTKRTVKGAAGGMLGVDYEDTRRPDPFLNRGDSSIDDDGPEQRQALRGEGDGDGGAAINFRSTDASKDHRPDRSAFSDTGNDQDAGDLTARTKQRRKIKKARHAKESDEEQHSNQEESSEPFEDRFEEFDSAEAGQNSDRPKSKYFEDTELGQPGDLSLVNPDTIQRRLGSPMAYAKHVMILAEAFRKNTGANRSEAISYMASMFLSLTDTRFGWSALKEFGHGTGIIDIYPLEVIEEIMVKYPGHLPKVSFGRIFRKSEKEEEILKTDTDTPLLLTYPEELKIRSFALKGGGVPGYTFEPAEKLGTYKLQIRAPGRFNVLIASLNRSGFSLIEALTIAVAPSSNYFPVTGLDSQYPERDEEKITAWPKPQFDKPNPIITAEDITPSTEQSLTLMSSADLLHFKTMSALTGPKGSSNDVAVPNENTAEQTAPNESVNNRIKRAPSAQLATHAVESRENGANADDTTTSAGSPEENELTTADKDVLKEVVAEIFDTQTGETSKSVDSGLQEDTQEYRNSVPPPPVQKKQTENIYKKFSEEHEEPSGESTEPFNQEDLAWIFEDSEG